MENYKLNRKIMKSNFDEDVESDQEKQLPQPPLEKPYNPNAEIIDLPVIDRSIITKSDIFDCILDRKSNRVYKQEALTLNELSYLLTMTQKVKEIRGGGYATLRPVPSAGARHPFETYLAINNVEGLKIGVYRYLAIEHKLLFIKEVKDFAHKITEGANDQKIAGKAPINFIWSCLPYRGEWRYGPCSYKPMLLDAGHICQAIYLACETIGLGTCAIASYDQKIMDKLIDADGEDEFVVYMAPVGRV